MSTGKRNHVDNGEIVLSKDVIQDVEAIHPKFHELYFEPGGAVLSKDRDDHTIC